VSLAEAIVDHFSPGLQLKERPGHQDGAIDLSDVWFPIRGRVAQRDGYINMLQAQAAADVHSVAEHRTAGGIRRLLVGRGTGGQAYTTGGATQGAALTGLTDGARWSAARVGTPALERTYIANGIEALQAYDETSGWSAPALTGNAGVGTGKHVAVFNHRLVNANFTGTADDRNPSAVRFSDVANPVVFGANNFVRIAPGDGEGIMGLGAWRDLLFAPKETKVAVFYGVDDDAAGNPVFHFETIDTGIGMAGHGACCVGPDGFYFLGRGGIYRMAGMEPPERISGAIDPIFEGNLPVHYELGGGGAFNHAQADKARMCWHDDRLYVALACADGTANNRVLMWDPALDVWTIWRIPAAGLISFRQQDQPELHTALAGSLRQVAAIRQGVHTDNGAAIGSYIQTAYTPIADDGTVVARQVKCVGAGRMFIQVAGDYKVAGGGAYLDLSVGVDSWGDGLGVDTWGGGGDASDVWGPEPALSEAIVRLETVRATRHSLRIAAGEAGQPWLLDQAVLYHYARSRRRKEVPTA
jgi:hypothetical protein